MGSRSKGRRSSCWALLIAASAAAAASAQTSGTQTEKPPAPETAPARPPATPLPAVAQIGPAREIKLAENTWFRFGAQVQAWLKVSQDRLKQPDGSEGGYVFDMYCRRCRFFTTGSVVKDVYFNVLFEAGNLGQTNATTGAKNPPTPSILDAYGQVKFADWFWLSGGSILLPLTRNGTQPTTTYVSIDNANVDVTPILQGNTNVIRDLGFQANGFFADNHLEYRLGVFQGSRQPPPGPTQNAGHNGPRIVSMLSFNFWDPETGYVNGGHYYGTRRVLGVMGNFDYQQFRKDAPSLVAAFPAVGSDKNAYYGLSGAIFLNLPLAGAPSPRGGDELVGLLQVGYYDGGLRQASTGAVTNAGTYPNVLKQTNYLAEAGYYNHSGHFSIFGKFEMRKISDDYTAATKAASNQTWIAGGLKYYVAPANFMNFALQYERIQNPDALPTEQSGTNNITFQMQTILY